MDLKTRVKTILITVIWAILLGASGYLVYFFVTDILSPPPKNIITKNLFFEKDSIDIANFKNTITDICVYPEPDKNDISFSLQEDKINDFIDDKQYQSLWKRFNYEYTEHFIALGDQYFNRSDWNCNDNITKHSLKIKNNGFVELNTPIWNSLEGFETNITCYNEMQYCISKIKGIAGNLRNHISVDEIVNIKTQKQDLVTRSCIKNKSVESELINEYKNLEEQAKANARLTVTPITLEYDASGSSITINVNTNVSSWSYSSVYSWLKIKESASSLTIICEANPDTKERTGNYDIKISFDKFETPWEKTFATINIKQKGKAAVDLSSAASMLRSAVNNSPTQVLSNGKYKGQLSNGIRSGLGVYYWDSGEYYFGNWVNNNMNGYGMQIVPAGTIIPNCPNCVVFVGNWSSGNRSGQGTCYDAQGKLIYYGNLRNNKPTERYPTTGYNNYMFNKEIKYDNGDKYIGEIKNGKRDGQGIYLWTNGDMWYGSWKDEIRRGYGIYISYGRNITTGRWNGDTYLGN